MAPLANTSAPSDLLTLVQHSNIYVYDLIAAQAQKTPQSEAIVTTTGSLTYSELIRRTNLVHQIFQQHESRLLPNDRVLLLSDKTPSAICSFLALLKLKTTCVIVNPAFPDERLNYIVSHTRCKAIVTDGFFEDKARRFGLPVLAMPQSWADSDKSLGGAQDAHPATVPAEPLTIHTPADGAVVTFTSGSTGKPKAVLYSHAALSNMAVALGRDFQYSADSRVYQFAAFGWVIVLQDIFITLVNGGTLCLPTTEQIENELVRSMKVMRANTLSITSSLVSTLDDADLEDIRTLIFVGEAANPETVVRLDRNGRNVIVNYGCSEANTILGTNVLIRGRELFWLRTNTTTTPWLVDPDDHNVLLTESGAIGELISESCTAPTGLLTEDGVGGDCFIEAPWWRASYPPSAWHRVSYVKTGDLFQRTEAGHWKCIGRKDFQIKIRGQRLDPSEVEYHVKQQVPGIGELACIKGRFRDSPKESLVVFVSFEPGVDTQGSDWAIGLDHLLLNHLPSYMLPAGFIEIDKLPRTATGKVDRRTIAMTMETISASDMITYINDAALARGDKQHNLSPCESLLQRLWSTVLRLDESTITPDSHFFRLGGDSIDAMKLARLARENNIELNVSTIISRPRLADLAHTVGHLDDVKPVTTTSSMQPATYAPFSLVTTHQQTLDKCLVEAARQCELSPSDITDMYPCTPMQSGLMALTAQRPDSYWVRHQFALPMDWTPAQAKAAGKYMVKQNEILRSRIVQLDNGECFHVVVNQDKQPPSTTAGGADPNGSPFGKPLFALYFEVNLVDGRVYMHWQVHHAIYDGWSARLMLQAFARVYLSKPDSNAPSPPFSSFVRTVLDIDWTPSAEYWERTLHGYEGQAFPRLPSTTVALPTHRITHTSSWHGGASGITASSMIRAAWALVLTRYCGSGDVVFGAIVTGRNHPVPGIESMMGPTICTVPVRVRTPRDYTVRQFSQHVQEQSGEMSVHEQFGLPRIQALGASGPAQAAKFQSLVIVQPADLTAAVMDDGAEIVEVSPGVDDYLTYPVTLECFLRQGTVSHTLTIDETSISRFEAECLMQHFAHVFETLQDPGVAESPALSVDLRSSEEAALLAQPNTPAPQAVEGCIHEMIFDAAAQCQQQPAVCAWDGELSYAELLWLSTTLAQRLISACVQPDTVVPIIHPKSRWTLVAMLAVLQAGGAFLLVDPALPFGRVQSQLDISGATTVLCGPEQAAQFASLLTSKTTICLDEPTKQDLLSSTAFSNDGSIPHSLRRAGPKHPAYVVMTSGTTGTPKGTVLEHRQVSSGFSAQVQRGLFRPGWRMLQFASYSFDPCIADMLGPLLVSGCVCIPRDEDRLTNLPAVLREFNVDIVELTPSISMLLDPTEVPGLKVLRFGGEAVTSAHVERWADSVHVENSYGPSECCVTCTLTPRVQAGVDPANFGSAIGCQLWVVDVEDRTKLAPRGLVGELAIQGPIVGRGYLNDADAAARAFLPCAPWLEPVDESPHSRVYMTGDLVRADADGTLVFVGRLDSQIKLRGQRIELGEIETVAGSLETVSEAIAVLVPGPAGSSGEDNLALVLRVESNYDSASSSSEHSSPGCSSSASSSSSLFDLPHPREIGRARPTLQKLDRVFGTQLPGYMKPTFWFVVDQLPMSTSGKIDRKAVQAWLRGLAAEDLEQCRASSLLVGHKSIRTQINPADETARQIRKLLDGLLTTPPGDELEDVQFASSGLDSIKSVSLVRSINQHFGIRLSMMEFLTHDTLAQVAREVDRLQHSPASSTAPATHSQSPVVHHLIQDLDTLARAIADSALSPTPSSSIGNVFLTGATGYVGTMLLRTLLTDPTVQHVYLLVRADSPTSGLRRITRAARIAGWWDDQFSNHITVWPGDLTKPQIGLTDSQWTSLSSTAINAIVHNGAMVNWFRSYAALKAANVDATAELLRAATGNPAITRFCFVSGGAQWDPEGHTGCLETTQLAADLSSTNGYGQSKLIAEQLVARTAAMPGVSPATRFATLKPGLIIGGSDMGVANTDDFLWRLVKACISLGAYCVESDAGAGYMYMARGEDIGQSMLDGLRTETPYWEQKMLRGMRVCRFWDAVNTALAGRPLKGLDYEAWIAALREQVGQQGSEHPCLPVMHYIEQGRDVLGCPGPRVELLGSETGETEREMEQAVIRNVQYLMEIGFFDSEPGRAMERADVFTRSAVV